jgi:FKBP-type peptidyl-prolyl cis-trans isomerase FklB
MNVKSRSGTSSRRRPPSVAESSPSALRAFVLLAVVAVMSTLPKWVDAGTNEAGLAFLAANRDKPGVVTLPSGLQYRVLAKGPGKEHPTIDAPCNCHYEGKLLDGTVFDSSYERGSPTAFAPNQVIKGWTEAMQKMVQGDKWELYIPSELGYGDRGSPPKIPGGDVLIFVMEILSIAGDTVPALTCEVVKGDDATVTTAAATAGSDCTEKEVKYIAKVQSWEGGKPGKEIKRIKAILGTPMSDDLRDWAQRRLHILEQFVDDVSNKDEL